MGSAVMRLAGSGRLGQTLSLQLVDILNTVQILSGQLTFIAERFELLANSCAKSDSLFVKLNAILHVYLIKV